VHAGQAVHRERQWYSFFSGSVCVVPERVVDTVRVSDALLLCSLAVGDTDVDCSYVCGLWKGCE
jgi:hypothetical protein